MTLPLRMLFFLMSLAFFATPPSALAAGIVIDTSATNIVGPIDSDGKLVGFPGDYMSITDGSHTLELRDPHGYKLRLELIVAGGRVAVKRGVPEPECNNQASAWEFVTWQAPSVKIDVAKPRATRIVLNKPVFKAATTNKQVLCAPVMVGCTQSHGILSVESDPVGAEIWIDGERMDRRTNARISVPFCKDGNGNAAVLLRMQNRLNCSKQIVIQSGSEQRITCQMLEP